MKRQILIAAPLMLFISASATADIYRCVDAHGHVTYSDINCQLSGGEVDVIDNSMQATPSAAYRPEARRNDVPSTDHGDAEYNRVLAQFERKYPEINPNSPSYDVNQEDAIYARMIRHYEGGATKANALRAAIRDTYSP